MSFLASSLSFSPLFQKLLNIRGFQDEIATERFLRSELTDLNNPFRMKGMEQAVLRIRKAQADQERVLIHGDYDVDGVTASAILAKTFSNLGISVITFLPDRVRDGYGVSKRALKEAKKQDARLMVTADCGITAHEILSQAKASGIDVIVVDHHKIPEKGLPPAFVILNPHQEDCPYPFKGLSAAGLAFKFGQALLGPKAFDYLDLAALSTVADVAPLTEENRVIVKHGLRTLANSPTIGLRALSQVAGIRSKEFNVGHLGFILGPRINACGRMSTADIALRLLLTNHAKEAESLAHILDEENKTRQKEERQTVKEAFFEVERTINFNHDYVIVVGRDGWHQGVSGIVASRLVDKFHRPALVVAFDGETGKGSARAMKGFNLYQALHASSEYLTEFGGHELAAGFSLRKDQFEKFRQCINHFVRETYPGETFQKTVHFDLEIRLGDLQSVFVRELDLLEPHGAGNPRPVFFTSKAQIKSKPVRVNSETVQLWLTDGELTAEARWRNSQGQDVSWLKEGQFLDVFYTLKTRQWNGMEAITLEIKDGKPSR